jgi:two-component system LytT family sensor kinase
MAHPFTSQRRALVIYSIIWLLAAVGNALMLRLNRDFPLSVSITEALLQNILFALLGLIIWYPTRYIPFRKEAWSYSLLAHVMSGVVVIAFWLILTVGILRALFGSDEAYNSYLSSSVFWRGFIGVMVYLVIVLIYYLISYARTLSERAQAEEKLRTLVKESELNLLKSQINPHFLFNSLNSISSLIISNPEEAREMIIRLSDFLRYSLKHRENEFVPLEEEIVRMKDYLSIEQIRFGDKLRYDLQASDNCRKVQVPTMILQPLIENAIKHGVYESLDPVSITFSCALKNEFLQLEIKNDFDPQQPSRKGTGVGLQNVSERIRLAYDGKAGLSKTSDNGVFKVTLYIPVENNN